MTTTPNDPITAHYATRNAFLDAIAERDLATADLAIDDNTNAIRCMTAMRDLALYIADAAAYRLTADYPFRTAFLDDDCDYMPAALDMMNDLMIALSSDYAELACDELISRIESDAPMISCPDIKYSDMPLDAPNDLPIIDPYDD